MISLLPLFCQKSLQPVICACGASWRFATVITGQVLASTNEYYSEVRVFEVGATEEHIHLECDTK